LRFELTDWHLSFLAFKEGIAAQAASICESWVFERAVLKVERVIPAHKAAGR
jgi:hypothetical protein